MQSKMSPTLIKSPLNYTGGKYKLLPQILSFFPEKVHFFIDLFCGGGNVGINVPADYTLYNDQEWRLPGLYKFMAELGFEKMTVAVKDIISKYGLSDSKSKSYEFYGCNSSEGLAAYNREGYAKLRRDFNSMDDENCEYYVYFFTLVAFSFNNQIRFNSKGKFNLPVGKRDFNARMESNLQKFTERLQAKKSEFLSGDFAAINPTTLPRGTFIYCDPPYLLGTASYNESGGWNEKDEKRLLTYLDILNSYGIHFALSNVLEHKGKTNHLLEEWCKKYSVHDLDFNYSNSNYQAKNTGLTREVLVTNY